MNKIACAALLIAVSLGAQNAPAPQRAPPPASEGAAQRQVHPEEPLRQTLTNEKASKAYNKLFDLGYFTNNGQPNPSVFTTAARCAIPLVTVPAPQGFAGKIIPATPSVDPKIVSAPPLPACPQNVAPVKITVPEPAADKK
jgi:hypothetical protein